MKAILIAVGIVVSVQSFAQEKVMKEIRTYMPFNFPVEPARIIIIPDMDLSYALASRLVEWSPSKQPAGGLAARWEIIGDSTYRFTLKENAKWSDGSPVLASEVKSSLERNLKKYPDDLRSLANLVLRIDCPEKNVIDFHLKLSAKQSNLLGKLTEPNFGITKVKGADRLDLSVTTGAFYLSKGSDTELVLNRNPHWYHFSDGIADQVTIRRPDPKVPSQTVLLTDPWPNMIETSSLLPGETLQRYENEKYQVWRRPIDKVFVFELSKKNRNSSGYALLRDLRKRLDRKEITKGLAGFSETNQLFPKGFQLHDLNFSCPEVKTAEATRKKLTVLISPARVSPQLRDNIEAAVTAVTGDKPDFISLPLQEAFKLRDKGEFDLYAGTYGIADPDPEGIMSFYFEGNLPPVPSGDEKFVARLDEARKEQKQVKRISAMRQIVRDAVCAGHILPLFHVSTIGIGRKELDFSSVPTSDESVTLSKVRFR